jgi:catechol 2,3-dioxygenase-like lactoylglutathione lyase family enzyme
MTPQLDLIGIVVKDMSASLTFYRRLGFSFEDSAEKEPHVEVTLPGGLRLAWDDEETIRSFDPDWTPPTGGHRVALAFGCADPAEVDRVYADLVGAGYRGHREPWDAFWGQRYAVVLDPDGNAVDLFAPLAQA